MLSGLPAADDALEDYVAELTADRLRATTQECRLTSVSDIIRENQIERIDLLKIDAEKSELEIIEGIADRDWPKIDQLVVEIHDPSRDKLARIERLLGAKGYRCVVEQETLLERAGLFNLYATRNRGGGGAAAGLAAKHRDLCWRAARLRQPACAQLVLCVCPRSAGAQSDAQSRARSTMPRKPCCRKPRASPMSTPSLGGAAAALSGRRLPRRTDSSRGPHPVYAAGLPPSAPRLSGATSLSGRIPRR